MKPKVLRFLILFLFVITISINANAQWQPCLGLEGGRSGNIIAADSFLFTSCIKNIYRTDTSFMNQWELISDLAGENLFKLNSCIISYGIMDEMQRSFDNGNTWSNVSGFGSTYTMCSVDSLIFFRDFIDIYKSYDYLETSEKITSLSQSEWHSIYSYDSLLIAIDYSLNNICQSLDLGMSWDTITKNGLPSDYFLATNMICHNNTIWLGGFESVFYLNSSRTSWIEVGLGLPEIRKVRDLIVFNSDIYCSITSSFDYSIEEDGLYRLNWINTTWEYIEGSPKDISRIDEIEGELYCGTSIGPVKMDSTGNWITNYSGLFHRNVSSFSELEDTIYVYANDELFKSFDDGYNFELIENVKGNTVITTDSIFYSLSYTDILISRDYGNSWDTITNGLQSHLLHLSITDSYYYISSSLGLYRSKVDSINWVVLNNGLSTWTISHFEAVDSVVIVNDYYSDHVVSISRDYGNTFDTLFITDGESFPIKKNGKRFYILNNESILYSDDLGITWDEIYSENAFTLDQNDMYLVVGGHSTPWPYLLLSYNNGQSCYDIEDNIPVDIYGTFWTINFYDQRLFVSSRYNSLWYRDDILTNIPKPDVFNNDLMNIYPNPTKDIITLQLDSPSQEGRFRIFDINGRELMSENIRGQKTEINLMKLDPGIYIIEVNLGTDIISQKFIKT